MKHPPDPILYLILKLRYGSIWYWGQWRIPWLGLGFSLTWGHISIGTEVWPHGGFIVWLPFCIIHWSWVTIRDQFINRFRRTSQS